MLSSMETWQVELLKNQFSKNVDKFGGALPHR